LRESDSHEFLETDDFVNTAHQGDPLKTEGPGDVKADDSEAYGFEDDIPGVAVFAKYSNFEEEVLTLPERRPYVFNLFFASFTKFVGDVIVQLCENTYKGRQGIDWRRTSVFVAHGFFYVGMVEWFIYVNFFIWLCPSAVQFANEPLEAMLMDRPGQIDFVKQVAFDNFVHYTFLYFPVFYLIKEFVQGPDAFTPRCGLFPSALRRYSKTFWTDNLCCWAYWIPGDTIALAVPMWLRLPTHHIIGFMWTLFLSFMRGARDGGEEKVEVKVEEK